MSLIKQYTNEDRLNDMNTKEKADFLCSASLNVCQFCDYWNPLEDQECQCPKGLDCNTGIKKWLKQKAIMEVGQ